MKMTSLPQFFWSMATVLRRVGARSGLLVGLFWLLAIAPALAAKSVELRVAVEEDVAQVKVGSSTKAIVRDSGGQQVGALAPMNGFVAEASGGGVELDRWQGSYFWIEPTEGGYVFIGDRWYRGRVLVIPTGSGLTAINYVDLEHYLYSVLGGEMNGNWPQEALKAQAVAARSYALYQRNKRQSKPFDVGDTAGWQVYRGLVDEAPGTQAATQATQGQVVTYNGEIIEAVFHSSAGGCVDNSEDVWVKPVPYLRSFKEDFQEQSPVAQWDKTFSQAELTALFPGIGRVVRFEPEKVSPICQRVATMRVVGEQGTKSVDGDKLRNLLNLRSTLFQVVPEPSKDKAASGSTVFRVFGRGFGHGLGLSQWGAYNLALQRRWSYAQILAYYYRNTELARIDVR